MNSIYLDHQASTPTDRRVVEKMMPFFAEEFGNPHSADHVFGWRANQIVEEARGLVAVLLGVGNDEVVFTSGATESNNHAILGSIAAAKGSARNRIVVSAVEHKCILEAANAAANLFGAEVLTAPVDSSGRMDLNWLEDNTDHRVAIVSAIGVNNEIGTVQDIPAISKIVHNVGALLHTDCAQAPLAIDINEISPFADLISLSGHKMYGPKGIGALYVARENFSRTVPLIYGGGQQANLRSGTIPTPLVAGFGEAAKIIGDENQCAERRRLEELRNSFIGGLVNAGIQIEVITPFNKTPTHPGNLNIRFRGMNAHELLQRIQPTVAASTGSACSSGDLGASHVLRAIGLSESDASECIRFSFGQPTTREDIEFAVDLISDALTVNLAAFSV